jgi:hypothetical protein
MLIQNDVNNIHQDLKNLSQEIILLPEIRDQVNQTTFELNNLNENITEIKNSIPSEFDETELQNRIVQLESKNSLLKNQLDNQTTLINNLNTELVELNTEMDNLAESQKEKIIEKESDNTLGYSAILLGIFGIVIAILAITLLFKKLGRPPEPPKEESRVSDIPEQQIMPEREKTSIEQPQVPPEVQNQQQEGLG